MKKIGIITFYYNSSNYGGLLQSYALCKYLNDHGVVSEQICYNHSIESQELSWYKKLSQVSFKKKIAIIIHGVKGLIKRKLTELFAKKRIAERKGATTTFRNGIPHSAVVYTPEIIHEVMEKYDAFITGSDRVWHPAGIGNPYYLSFVHDKPKASYAASLAATSLTSEQKIQLVQTLNDYDMVSVREAQTKELLQNLVPVGVDFVLDPTLLLTADEWGTLASKYICPKDYIFCYFMGGDYNNRKAAMKYAKKRKLSIVTIPYANNVFNIYDTFFGDVRISDAGPEDFISLLKNAKAVFTDSFHASVFSSIFHKDFFVFSRADLKDSGSRIESFTDLIGIPNRYCNSSERKRSAYIEAQSPINYDIVDAKLQSFISFSQDWLDRFIQLVQD